MALHRVTRLDTLLHKPYPTVQLSLPEDAVLIQKLDKIKGQTPEHASA